MALVGTFTGSIKFGNTTYTAQSGESRAFVASVSAAGAVQWSAEFGPAVEMAPVQVAVGPSDEVVVVSAALTQTYVGPLVLRKYTSSGTLAWAKTYGSSTKQADVAIDAAGNILVTGDFAGTISFGGPYSLTSAGQRDTFLVKLDPDGNEAWSKRFGSALDDVAGSVAVSPNGAIVIGGYYNGTINFGGNSSLNSAGGNDMFLAQFSAAGLPLWSRGFGSIYTDKLGSLAIDVNNNIVATGQFQGTVDFGGGPLTSVNYSDAVMMKFDSSGTHLWSKRYGNSSSVPFPASVAIGTGGEVLVGGTLGAGGPVDLGTGPLPFTGSNDAFVAKFGP